MLTIYNAPKPTYTKLEWFKFIALRLILPPVLLWDLLKFGINKLFGQQVSHLILPAQTQEYAREISEIPRYNLEVKYISAHNTESLYCKKYRIVTHDKACLDTLEIQNQSQAELEPQHQRYIINLLGNGMHYEHVHTLKNLKADANELNANVVAFNYRGVGQSTGSAKSKDDLVTDGIAQVQRLLDQGVSPQNITLKAHSLGAGIGSLVALHFHKLGQPINIFNSRSFSSITNFIVGHLRLKRNQNGEPDGTKETVGGKILGWLLKPLIKLALTLVNWEIDAGSAFKRIPKAYREHIVVRSKKNAKHIDDATIPHYASIHKELASERRELKAPIDKRLAEIRRIDTLANPQLVAEQAALIEARLKIKSNKMENAKEYEFENGHNLPFSSLQNRSGTNAHTFFKEFLDRAEQDHGVKNLQAQLAG